MAIALIIIAVIIVIYCVSTSSTLRGTIEDLHNRNKNLERQIKQLEDSQKGQIVYSKDSVSSPSGVDILLSYAENNLVILDKLPNHKYENREFYKIKLRFANDIVLHCETHKDSTNIYITDTYCVIPYVSTELFWRIVQLCNITNDKIRDLKVYSHTIDNNDNSQLIRISIRYDIINATSNILKELFENHQNIQRYIDKELNDIFEELDLHDKNTGEILLNYQAFADDFAKENE